MKALALLRLAACTNIGPTRGLQTEVTALAQAIRAMSPTVDPAEATRAAQVSYAYTHQLAQHCQITDAPLIHNAKVNAVLPYADCVIIGLKIWSGGSMLRPSQRSDVFCQ